MLVAEILKDKGDAVFSVEPGLSVGDASRVLLDKRIGALIVCEGDRVAGVFSERDVVRAVATDGPASLGRPVTNYMSVEVVYAQPGDTMADVMARMTDRRIRHLPVLKEQRLCGVVSIGDVVKRQIAEATQEADSLRTYIAAG